MTVMLLLLGLALLLVPMLRALRGSAIAGFWATGLLLSLVPISATFPSARLLTFAGLGGAALVWRLGRAAHGVRKLHASRRNSRIRLIRSVPW